MTTLLVEREPDFMRSDDLPCLALAAWGSSGQESKVAISWQENSCCAPQKDYITSGLGKP